MKIAFACPSYGPIEPEVAHAQRFAIMTAWRSGIEVRSDVFTDRVGWEESRNNIAHVVCEELDDTFDGVFWCDADTILNPETIYNTVAPGVDVCTAIYYGRHAPYEPRIFAYNSAADSWNPILRWPEGTSLFPIQGAGFGAIYTSRKALIATTQTEILPKRMCLETGEIEEKERKFWFRFGKWSEDLTWCAEARAKGFLIWCNPNEVVGHLGTAIKITRKQYEEHAKSSTSGIIEAAMTLEQKPDGQYEVVVVKGLDVTPEKTPVHNTIALTEELRMKPSA